jgi:hypothetical protein
MGDHLSGVELITGVLPVPIFEFRGKGALRMRRHFKLL